jgi:hypothetical protein
LARERYLLHEGEETIHQTEAEIQLKTPHDKWQNFWYYHKWHVLIGVFVFIVAAYMVHDLVSRTEPDYQVMLITQSTVSTDAVDALEQTMEKYGEDLNGDGTVSVQVSANVISNDSSSEDPNERMAGVVHLQADLTEGTSILFLTDDQTFREQQKETQLFSYTDGTNPATGATDYDRMRVALKDCKAFAGLKTALPDGGEGQTLLNQLSVSLRVFQGTGLDKKQDKQEYYAANKKLFAKITAK